MKQFRYIVKGEPYIWQDADKVTQEELERIRLRFNKFYGDDWQIEYREVNDGTTN